MNVSSWLQQARTRVPSLEAELIAQHLLGLEDRSRLVLLAERELETETQGLMDEMLRLRASYGVPMAYVLGKKEFYGREFGLDMQVLIPRPETEAVVELTLELVRGLPQPSKRRLKVVDVGTGSGCIAITLALELDVDKVQVTGVDQSVGALKVARQNAKRLGAKVEFKQADLLAASPAPDVVVANLPYVDPRWEWRSPEIKFEPETALFAGDGGLAEIKRLIDQVAERPSVKYLILEADPSQHQALVKYAAGRGLKKLKIQGFAVALTRG